MSVRKSANLWAIAAVGALTLTACSSSSTAATGAAGASSTASVSSTSGAGTTAASASSAAATASTVKSIFFANPLPSYPDWATADSCFKAETARLGIKGVTQGPTGSAINDQFVLDRITQAIAVKNYDAIMAVPISPSAYEPLFERAKKQGMKIATLNTGTATKTQDFEVGTDYPSQGKAVADNLGKRSGKQVVGIITNQAGGVGDTIINAFKANLPANVTVAATAFDAGDPNKTADVVGQMLTGHPDINIVFSWEGTATAGITTAIKEKNQVGKVFGVVNDLTPQVVDGIKAGTIYGASKQHFCDMAKKAVDMLVDAGSGKTLPATTDTGITFVTKDNLDAELAKAKSES